GINQDFGYTSTIPNPTASNPTTPSCSLDSTPSSFTLNDHAGVDPPSPITAGTDNTEHCGSVPAGSYTVTEGAEPANFTLESLTCTAVGAGASGSQDAPNPAQENITVTPDSVVTCTYTNHTTGAILVTKTAKNHNLGSGQHPLAGASFTVNGVTKTTGANGQACFDGLTIGTSYTVTETAAPPGYAIDTSSKSVTPTSSANCAGAGTPTGVSFTDSPLTDISASANSEVPGVTNSTITCVDSGNANVGNSPQGPADPVSVSATGLKPGTYTCTVVIDPCPEGGLRNSAGRRGGPYGRPSRRLRYRSGARGRSRWAPAGNRAAESSPAASSEAAAVGVIFPVASPICVATITN